MKAHDINIVRARGLGPQLVLGRLEERRGSTYVKEIKTFPLSLSLPKSHSLCRQEITFIT